METLHEYMQTILLDALRDMEITCECAFLYDASTCVCVGGGRGEWEWECETRSCTYVNIDSERTYAVGAAS